MTTNDREAFTEKQMSVGKEEFERWLAGQREYAYSDAHPVLTRSIRWEVAYVDSVLAELVSVRAEAAQLEVELGEMYGHLRAVRAEVERLQEALRAADRIIAFLRRSPDRAELGRYREALQALLDVADKVDDSACFDCILDHVDDSDIEAWDAARVAAGRLLQQEEET